MTRACLIHALHPDEDERVILKVYYTQPGIMRVGVEAIWRAPPTEEEVERDASGEEKGEETPVVKPRYVTGWDKEMPAVRGSYSTSADGSTWLRSLTFSRSGALTL